MTSLVCQRLLHRSAVIRAPALLERALVHAHQQRTAIVNDDGTRVGYADLIRKSEAIAAQISSHVHLDKLGRQPRVAHLCSRDSAYVTAQFACWQSGGIAVPLANAQPPAEWEYVLSDSTPNVVIIDKRVADKGIPVCNRLGLPFFVFERDVILSSSPPRLISPSTNNDGALFIYTSGTTGKPKGVVHTHGSLQAQIDALISTWRWSSNDRILNVLPLHHIHGIVNVVACGLSAGAVVEMHESFSPSHVWQALTRQTNALTLFMAVPTVYSKLMEFYHSKDQNTQTLLTEQIKHQQHLRLMVSGSAALPLSVLKNWKAITGFHLLERYGMSEFGMALSNLIETNSEDSSVGFPLPGVECRLVNEDDSRGTQIFDELEATGELQVRGQNMFREYWNLPESTKNSFTDDGWFKTGDLAHRSKDGRYYIRGRLSMDILKSGGYKLSALEIERELLEHPSIAECIVLGVPDEVYGQRVAAVIVPKDAVSKKLDPVFWDNKNLPLSAKDDSSFELLAWSKTHFNFREWAAQRLAPYKIPTIVRVVSEIPRNAMLKVNKKAVLQKLFPSQ